MVNMVNILDIIHNQLRSDDLLMKKIN